MLKILLQGQSIVFSGELNRDTVVAYWPFKLMAEVKGSVAFDLAEVKHVDTAGLAWLIQQLSQAKATKLEVKLLNVPAQLKSLAQVSAVLALLPIES